MSHVKSLMKRLVKKAGNQKKLAKALGLSQQGISYLTNKAPRVSPQTAIAIDRFTDGEVPKEKLRPDIFGAA